MKKLSKSTLRWFIGTKGMMPIVEIRRRFGIEGDEVTELQDDEGKLYVGLPEHAARALEELKRSGKVGYEFSVDFHARVLIGAYVIFRKGQTEQAARPAELEGEAELDGAQDAA